jgi:hypothetical protein
MLLGSLDQRQGAEEMNGIVTFMIIVSAFVFPVLAIGAEDSKQDAQIDAAIKRDREPFIAAQKAYERAKAEYVERMLMLSAKLVKVGRFDRAEEVADLIAEADEWAAQKLRNRIDQAKPPNVRNAEPAGIKRFNSALSLRVLAAQGALNLRFRALGTTPAMDPKGIEVPATGVWFVEPTDRDIGDREFAQITKELADQQIPGLRLDRPAKLTGEALEAIAKLEHLRALSLAGCRGFKAEQFAHIAGLEQLEQLALNGLEVDDEVMSHVGKIKSLRHLALVYVSITDKGMEHVGKLRNLRGLYFGACHKFSNAGLQHIAGLGKLTDLVFDQCTKITDAGLPSLTKLRSLKTLNIDRNSRSVTDQGIKFLRKALPDTKVSR